MKLRNTIAITASALLLSGLFAFKMLTSAWKIDTKDAKIHFTMPNGKHDGTISGLTANLDFDPSHPDLAAIKATVEVATINTGADKLNGHLQTADFFDAANHPSISFTAESVTKNDTGFVAVGKLAMRDSVHTISIPFTFVQTEKTAVIKGKMDIFAGDYGVGQKSPGGNDRVVVEIEIPLSKE